MTNGRRWRSVAVGTSVLCLLACASARAIGDHAPGSFPGAPASQRFGEFGRCPLAPASRYLPTRAGCVTVRRGDVDGDRRADLIVLYGDLNARRHATGFTLEVIRAGGGRLLAKVSSSGMNATIARVRNVNGRPGVEIFVHEAHITTEERVGVYTFGADALRRAGSFAYGGEDAGIRFGVTCQAKAPASIVQHEFQERTPFKGVWTETSTTYRWRGARLSRVASRKRRAKPTSADVGVRC